MNWRAWPLGAGPGRVEVRGEVLEVDATGGAVCPRCRKREPVWICGEHAEGIGAYGALTVRPDDQEDEWRAASAPLPPPVEATERRPAAAPVFSVDRRYAW